MKRLITLLLALNLLLSVSACSTAPEPEQKTETEENTEQAEEAVEKEEMKTESTHVVAGVFWYEFKDAYLSTVREALDYDLTAAGVEFTNYDAENQQSVQNDQIDFAMTNGANLLIVNIVDTAAIDAAQNICDKAKDAGIPIIFFNREVADEVITSYDNACYVGVRVGDAYEKQGQMAGEYIRDNYDKIDLDGDGNISYIFMMGGLGSSEEFYRGIRHTFEVCDSILTEAGYPELEYYDANNADKFQPSDWSRQRAFELMETALSTNPMDGEAPIEAAFANNDDAALGVIDALNNAGWNTGEDPEKTIPVFGVDYTADAQAAIEAGKMTGSILQSATGLAETITALVRNVQAGENVFTNIESFNVDEFAAKIRVPYEIKV